MYKLLASTLNINVTSLSFAREQVCAAELSWLHRLLFSDDSDRRKVFQSRSSYRSLTSRPLCRMLTQRWCRSIAVHRRWCRLLWAPTTLVDLTDLLVTSLYWNELLVGSQSLCSYLVKQIIVLVLTASLAFFFHNFYWRLASKSLHVHRTSSDWLFCRDVTRRGYVLSTYYSDLFSNKKLSWCWQRARHL